MKLIVGLGNVGARYARTRHNVGFMAVDRIAGAHGFSAWRRKFQGEIAEGRLGDAKCTLLKPGTMMNLSGQAVGEAARFLKIAPEDVIVLHDEIDLAPSKCRVKRGGGHAGHNGLRSIHQHIGPDYVRVRIGVGHPGDKAAVANYVLHDFAKADEAWLDDLLRGVADGAPLLAAGDDAGFMNAVALRTRPQRPEPAKPAKSEAPAPSAAPEAPDPASASPFARLLDRFRN
ncbi:aminoacyl-tRNA hydrolase [Pikeienuella piscinae]|uniref:Peptidyl-tRNA hydrolase n=1 Tax=Pikeienuella piscinae TaxID=2748098 RepID=A0A7L5BYA4_9RHOB|nr:aminoacyl-tRNA hydrolase [Pikeienuella piscinae]QIE56113.1 aminoacyl-tRNA hydrolase [Pikeienuella piscinae]